MRATTDSVWGTGAGHDASPGPRRRQARRVVVGLGNDIAGDDAIGLRVAARVRERLNESDEVDVVPLPWAGFALLDVLRGRTKVAIVDCLTSGLHPAGTVVRLDEAGIAGSVRLNSFHDLAFPDVMALGRCMGFEMPAEIAIWGIEADRVDEFCEGLSPAVAAAIEPAADEVLAFISTDRSRPEPMEVGR